MKVDPEATLMVEVKEKFEYRVGGSLESDAPSYVRREADLAFYQGLKAGEFCYVLNSRQMGKSSLRVQTMRRLEAEGKLCAFIDLTGMGKQDVTPEKWYGGIVQSLVSCCQLATKVQWRTWWRERRDVLSPVQRLSLFIEEVLLVEVQQNIVIFVDEIDRVLSQNFPLDDFFALIRFFFQQREVYPAYKRLTFALLGVASPADLIQDKSQTPFNIGRAIELQGFQIDEVQPLIEGLQGKVSDPQGVMAEILAWTGGQPFLTQKICHLLALESARGKFPSVEQLVRSRILENWESQDEPEHLRTIRDRLCYRDERRMGGLLGLYEKILQQGEIPSDGSPEQVELRLSGLVVERQGKLQVYNRIYQAVFNLSWLEQKLAELRPYATAIAAWLASGGEDESHLLQGQVLQNALAWALGKSLSDWDYQFLGASQDLAKRQAQSALEVVEHASQLLATARQEAQQSVLKQRLQRGWIPLIALGVTAPILLLRLWGLWQGLEWDLLDQFFRWRPLEPPDNRIAIVTIDEADIAWVGQWPIPDRLLAQAITTLKAEKPKAIGLDIYRDLPVEPGNADFAKLLRSTANIFAIEKVVGNRVAPPPALSQKQVGFSDQVLDGDGKLRRALLSVVVENDEVRYSLAVKLALHYLADKGISLKTFADNPQRLQLGKATFERFERNDGGYVRAQSGGYQTLLNFRGTEQNFATFSLRQVLEEKIAPEKLRDRLILIGTNAESVHDAFSTPYSGGLFRSPLPMAGVTIHANIISQILSAAIDGRPLLRVWSDPLEWLWILAWGIVGAGISWWLKFPPAIVVSLLLAGAVLFGISYLAFLGGWWLPLVPAMLTLVGAAMILPLVTQKQREQLLFRRTLASLLGVCQDYPTSGRIALEYLKQSENPENQAFIEEQMRSQKIIPAGNEDNANSREKRESFFSD